MKDQEKIQFVPLNKIPALSGVGFFFTTRQGGESQGGYGGLNLGLHVADDPKRVHRNRQALQQALSLSVDSLVFVNQVHGVTTLHAPLDTEQQPDADGLVTTHNRVALAIMTADCAPLLLADPVARVVGAAHAGWRGAEAGIVASCLEQMVALGSRPENVVAIIGPCIRSPSYEVGDQFRKHFLEKAKNKNHFGCQKFFSYSSDQGTVHFDLPGYLHEQLTWNHVSPDKIYDVGLCTYLNDDLFFSHRRTTIRGEAQCGRQVGGIYLC
ncbi:MAG: peptidoglycan editing factor PgeF [Magnetococcales bacterium]|nr:peptidoglycan editing factor PgeF [Magnetococcales bacterium]